MLPSLPPSPTSWYFGPCLHVYLFGDMVMNKSNKQTNCPRKQHLTICLYLIFIQMTCLLTLTVTFCVLGWMFIKHWSIRSKPWLPNWSTSRRDVIFSNFRCILSKAKRDRQVFKHQPLHQHQKWLDQVSRTKTGVKSIWIKKNLHKSTVNSKGQMVLKCRAAASTGIHRI